jgi:hypothetical protein
MTRCRETRERDEDASSGATRVSRERHSGRLLTGTRVLACVPARLGCRGKPPECAGGRGALTDGRG